MNNLIWHVRRAQKASELALSWRDYRVGAAAIAYDPKTRMYGTFVGANIKPGPDSDINIHAEQMVLAKVKMHDLPNVVAMAIWGDPDDKDSNPFGVPTRRPCQRCDQMFMEAPEVSERMLILSSNKDLTVCEFYSPQELHDYYERGNLSAPINEIPHYDLSDAMDDQYYTEEIELTYLLPKIWRLFPESQHVQRFKLDQVPMP
jgi:cytidine deaminase